MTAKGTGKKKKRAGANALIIICVAALVVCGLYLGKYLLEQNNAEKAFRELKVGGADIIALHKKNKDCIGWIKIDGTKVDYPVMWTPDDPQKYLRLDFNKEYSIAGTPFLDGLSDPRTSKNQIIYGHNIKAGTMFHCIPEYEDPKFFKKHRFVDYETIYKGKERYEVIGAFKTETYTFRYFDYALIEDEKRFDEYVEKVREINLLDTDKKLSELDYAEDKLLCLSTCSYHVSDRSGRFVVVCALTD